MIKHSLLFMVIVILLPMQVTAAIPDKPDTQDHPLLSRFAGSVIDKYQERQFDLYELPLGPVSPVAANNTSEGKALNRRVELVVK